VKSSGVAKSRWCPKCGAEYVTQMTTCTDCLVALVDEQPRDEPSHELVPYDMTAWDDAWRQMLWYQLNGRRIQYGINGTNMLVRADDRRKVDELIHDLAATHPVMPETPDAFILPDGRRVKELPIGPAVPTRVEDSPVDWIEERSWTFRWLVSAARDVIRRVAGRT